MLQNLRDIKDQSERANIHSTSIYQEIENRKVKEKRWNDDRKKKVPKSKEYHKSSD